MSENKITKDNLSMVIDDLNNLPLEKKLTREQISKMSYSEIMRFFNLYCETPTHPFFRKKGKIDHLFNFNKTDNFLKKNIKKIISLFKRKHKRNHIYTYYL